MEMIFDYTSLEAYLSNKADRHVLEQLFHSGSMLYTYDMVLDDLYESRKDAVGAIQANDEMQDLRSLFVIWTYPAFDGEACEIQGNETLAYVDAACVAIARQLSCPLITASHLIFDSIMEQNICGVLFTR